MTPDTQARCEELCLLAAKYITEGLGYAFASSNPDKARRILYEFLAQDERDGETRFFPIMITKSPHGNNELWLIAKQDTKLGAPGLHSNRQRKLSP